MDYNKSYSFRQNESARQKIDPNEEERINQYIISDFKSCSNEEPSVKGNPLSQYKILQQFSTQLLLENIITGNRVIYKEFIIPSNKGFKEIQNELLRRRSIEYENVLRLNLFLMEKQANTENSSKQKFGVVFDNFIRDFDSELEARKANKKKMLEQIHQSGIKIHTKEHLYQGLQMMAKSYNASIFWTEEELLNTLESILQGVSQLHQHNIIHGDITASSVVFCDDGYVKLADQFVTNPDNYQKEKLEQFNQSFIPPENTLYTPEGDLWAVGMVFLEAATLESSLDCYKEDQQSRSNGYMNQSQYKFQIDFNLVKSRLDDVNQLQKNQHISNSLQEIIRLLLSKQPSERYEAFSYFQSLQNFNQQIKKKFNQISQNIQKKKPSLSQKQMSKSNCSQRSINEQDGNEINVQLNQKVPSMNLSLSLHQDVIKAHQSRKQKYKTTDLNLQYIDGWQQDNVPSSLSSCTQTSIASQQPNCIKGDDHQQVFVNSNILKQNKTMKNKIKGLNKSSHIKKLDEICNIGISIPSLEVSPITNEPSTKQQQNYQFQMNQQKKITKAEKENVLSFEQDNLKQKNKKYEALSKIYPSNLNQDNVKGQAGVLKALDQQNQVNLTIQSRQSTMIDFHLSNPSNKNAVESIPNLSFESQSCKSQVIFPQKQSNILLQQQKFKNQTRKENEYYFKDEHFNSQQQQFYSKPTQALNNSVDCLSQLKQSIQKIKRERSYSSTQQQSIENQSNHKNKKQFSQSINKTFDQLMNDSQLVNTQNSNNLGDLQSLQINICTQNQSDQVQNKYLTQHRMNPEKNVKVHSLDKNQQSDIQLNDRARSQMSLKKQYSDLSNMIDSCLQRSRSVISSSLSRNQNILDKSLNHLNSSFQNTSTYQSQFNNSSYNNTSKLQTTAKKSFLLDQQKLLETDEKKNCQGTEVVYRSLEKDNYEDQEKQYQTNKSTEQIFCQNQNLSQPNLNIQQVKGQQDSPVISQRRNLPPKSTSRSSKKGNKQDIQQQEFLKNNSNVIQKQINSMNIQIQLQQQQSIFEGKDVEVEIKSDQVNLRNADYQQLSHINHENDEEDQSSLNQCLDNSLKRSRALIERVNNKIQNQIITSDVNSSLILKTRPEETISFSQQLDQQSICELQQKENQIQNGDFSEQSCRGDSFQVFQATSESSTHREQIYDYTKLDSSQIKSFTQQSDSSLNLKKPTPQKIQIKIQNFIYDDEWISYDGQYFNNTFSGVGYLKLKDNCSYHGEFLMGKLNGYGSFHIGQQNSIILGYFQNNILIKKCN